MPKIKIKSPVKGFTGDVVGVAFVKGEGDLDTAASPSALAYFRRHGYAIESAKVEQAEEVDLPAKSASKSDWVAFAVSQGVDEAEAEAMTRDALAERFADEKTEG